MKIAHFLYDNVGNPWLGGGGAVREHEINRRLASQGHEIHVICGAFPGKVNAYWEQDGVHYHSCGRARSYWQSRLWFSFLCRRTFVAIQRTIKFDLVVDDTSAFTFSAPWRVWRGPMIAVVHHLVGRHSYSKFGPLGVLFFMWERYNLRHYSRLIAVSKSTASGVAKRVCPSADINVIYNGVSDQALRSRSNHRNPHQILYLGRIEVYNKGLDTLLQVFGVIAKESIQLRLVIAGAGKDELLLDQMVATHEMKNQIVVKGKVSEEQKWELLSSSAVLLMPSRYEGWGIVAVEAAACGCPLIASDIPGLREAVEYTGDGWLVSDWLSVSEKILPWLQKPMNQINASRIQRLTWDQVANDTAQCYSMVKI